MPVLNAVEELTRYDLTRDRLREALSDHIPDKAILDNAVTTYAYWVCTSLNQDGTDWEQVLKEYTEMAVPCSDDEWEGECREVELIQRELQGVQGPVLDVGAGWGRLAPLYRQLGLPAAYIEPVSLGVRLMHRDGLARVVQCPGEALPFATNSFAAVVIGWVLHHRATPNVDPDAILSQAARVTIPDGLLISVEPLGERFTEETWAKLLESAGFAVDHVERFYTVQSDQNRPECYALMAAIRRED